MLMRIDIFLVKNEDILGSFRQVNYDYLINITKGFSLSGSIWGTLFYIIRISSRDVTVVWDAF